MSFSFKFWNLQEGGNFGFPLQPLEDLCVRFGVAVDRIIEIELLVKRLNEKKMWIRSYLFSYFTVYILEIKMNGEFVIFTE